MGELARGCREDTGLWPFVFRIELLESWEDYQSSFVQELLPRPR